MIDEVARIQVFREMESHATALIEGALTDAAKFSESDKIAAKMAAAYILKSIAKGYENARISE